MILIQSNMMLQNEKIELIKKLFDITREENNREIITNNGKNDNISSTEIPYQKSVSCSCDTTNTKARNKDTTNKYNDNINNIKNDNNKNTEIFCGYASIFNVKDIQNDIVLPEALSYINDTKMNVPILWQHDVEKPVGRVIEAYTDDIGLFIYATIDENLIYGREAKNALLSGTVNGMSIGYKLDKKSTLDVINFLQKIQIFEISLVTLPANELTLAKLL